MNTGQLLVSLSGLPSGSALAHLLAITTGTGETIYSHQMIVVAEYNTTTVTSLSKKTAPPEQEKQSAQKTGSRGGGKHVSIFTRIIEIAVLTSDARMFVTQKALSSEVLTNESSVNVSRKKM